MKETVRVCKVSGNTLTLMQKDTTACFGCMNTECKKVRNFFTLENSSGRILRPGDSVEINLSPRAFAVQTLSALLPPVLGFTAAYVLSAYTFPGLGEAARTALGAVAMFAAALGFYAFRRRFPAKTGMGPGQEPGDGPPPSD
ncbi:MAG: SoxR reducing system RseC family protein [Treponema sp.]|jgi:positive regulator of sigma E activity|nr:SoxR reducing system RseC family protein [Treponema sp.]